MFVGALSIETAVGRTAATTSPSELITRPSNMTGHS